MCKELCKDCITFDTDDCDEPNGDSDACQEFISEELKAVDSDTTDIPFDDTGNGRTLFDIN